MEKFPYEVAKQWREGKSVGEIARSIGISLNGVHSLLVKLGEIQRSTEINLEISRQIRLLQAAGLTNEQISHHFDDCSAADVAKHIDMLDRLKEWEDQCTTSPSE